MAEPFALQTADARFDPRQPVRVNGFLYHPVNEGGPHEVDQTPNISAGQAGRAGQGKRADGPVKPARPDYAALGFGSEWEAEGRN